MHSKRFIIPGAVLQSFRKPLSCQMPSPRVNLVTAYKYMREFLSAYDSAFAYSDDGGEGLSS